MSSASPVYRAAVVGCGRIGSLLEGDPRRGHPCTHAGGYSAHPRTELATGCDIRREKRDAFRSRWGISRVYRYFRDMFRHEQLDIVSIAVPTRLHSIVLEEAVKSGVRGVILEKPVDVNLGRAGRALKRAEDAGVKVLVNHTRRWNRHYQHALDLVKQGEIGEIISMAGWSLGGSGVFADDMVKASRYSGGGTLLHDGTHLLDCMRMFAGEPEWAFADVKRRPGAAVEDVVHGIIGFRSGVVATVEAGGPREYFAFELDISGSRGRIRIGNGLMELYQSAPSRKFEGFTELQPSEWGGTRGFSNFFVCCVDNMVLSLDGVQSPVSGGNDGLAALEMVYALYRSAELGRKVTFPLQRISRSPITRQVEKEAGRPGFRASGKPEVGPGIESAGWPGDGAGK